MPYYGSYDSSSSGLSWAGKGGFMLALILFIISALLSGNVGVPALAPGAGHGVCFPSVSTLLTHDFALSHWLNVALYFGAALYTVYITKHFNFVPSDNLLYATAMLLMCSASPWLVYSLNDGIVMLWVVLICLHILFSLYGRRNCSEGIFLIFSFLSWGTMVLYGFLLVIPVFLLGAIFLRTVRVREVVAMLLGLVTPYWIVLATGWVDISDLRLPSMGVITVMEGDPLEVFRLMLTLGITAVLFLFVLLVNVTRHGSAGVMVRARWAFLQLLGLSAVVFILIDFPDMIAFLPVLYLCTGYGCAQWSIRMRASQKQYLVLALFAVYVAIAVVFECL